MSADHDDKLTQGPSAKLVQGTSAPIKINCINFYHIVSLIIFDNKDAPSAFEPLGRTAPHFITSPGTFTASNLCKIWL